MYKCPLSSVYEHLGCFQLLAMMNRISMNIDEQVSLWWDIESFGYTPKSGRVKTWGRSIPNLLRKHHACFHSDCTSLHFHQQWVSIPPTPYPYQLELSFVLLILVILTGIRWNLRVILICISLMTNHLDHFFKCLSAICICDPSFENFLGSSIPHFLVE